MSASRGSGRPLHALVTATQFIAASAALAFVVLLFVNEPDSGAVSSDGSGSDSGASAAGQPDGATLYADNCARCHGPDGGGAVGPQLSEGRAAELFPNVEDQIAVVANGQGGMPAFGGNLSPEEIQAVVDYTRTL